VNRDGSKRRKTRRALQQPERTIRRTSSEASRLQRPNVGAQEATKTYSRLKTAVTVGSQVAFDKRHRFLVVQSYLSSVASTFFTIFLGGSVRQYQHETCWHLQAQQIPVFSKNLFTQAQIQSAYYTDCIWEVSLSLLISPTIPFGFCVLRLNGLLSLQFTRQRKIYRDCSQ
jgi:hypothetical protein